MIFNVGDVVFVSHAYAIGRGAGNKKWVGKKGVVVERNSYKKMFVEMFCYKVLIDGVQLNLDEREVSDREDGS